MHNVIYLHTVCKTIVPGISSAIVINRQRPTVTESSMTLDVGGCQQLVLLVSFHPSSLLVYGFLESDRHQLKSNFQLDQKICVRFQLPRLLVHARHFTQAGRQAGCSSWMAGHSQTSLGRRRRRFALTLLEE